VTIDSDAGKVWHIINDSGSMTTAVYVAGWNGPTGPAHPGSSASLGIATLARELVEYGDKANGAMFWLENGTRDPVSCEACDNVTGLFTPGMTKRPTYHLLRLIYRLQGVVLYQSEGLVVIRKVEGEYGMITYNARPFSESQGASGSIDLEIALAGMPPGRYRSEAFIFDGQRCVNMDDDAASQGHENDVAPHTKTSEAYVDGAYVIRQRLGPGCAALRLIKRIPG
jgi:beta-xylosidase